MHVEGESRTSTKHFKKKLYNLFSDLRFSFGIAFLGWIEHQGVLVQESRQEGKVQTETNIYSVCHSLISLFTERH